MSARDSYSSYAPSLSAPATRVETVTPADDTDLAHVTRAINVATSGMVALMTPDGATADVFVAAGIAFPVRASRILVAGTTATGIRGLS